MKKVLITGARSGIIYPVIQMLKENYFVYVTVHTDSELKYIKKMYKSDKNVICMKFDITKDLKKIDDLDIDVLVCNAASAESGSLLELDVDKVRNNFEVNVFSNLSLIQKAFFKMANKKNGKIIIISSLIGKFSLPFLGSYAGSKAALSSMARAMYYESLLLDFNLDIVLIEPGLYCTGFNKLAFDKKYDFMNYGSFFDNQIELIRKSENVVLRLFEKKNLDSICKKIYESIIVSKPRFRYSAPFLQNIFVKIINLFY